MAKVPDQYNSNAPVGQGGVNASPFFVQQWNLLLQFVKDSVASIAALVTQVAAAAATATAAAATAAAAAAKAAAATAPTGVTPGSYTNTNLTVGPDGRLTAAANGSGGGGGISPFWATPPTAPTTALFTVLNGTGGTSTITNTTRGVILETPGSAFDYNTLLQQVVPSATYTLQALFNLNFPLTNARRFGLFIKDNATGKIRAYELAANNLAALCVTKGMSWTDINTFSAQTDFSAAVFPKMQVFWLKLVVGATNLTFSISMDGEYWLDLVTESKTLFTATPDRCGIIYCNDLTETPNGTSRAHIMGYTCA